MFKSKCDYKKLEGQTKLWKYNLNVTRVTQNKRIK